MSKTTPMPHKDGWVEQELHRIAAGFEVPVSERHFQILVAEALLMLLTRPVDRTGAKT